MMATRGKGKVTVGFAALKRALMLPESARIIAVLQGPESIEKETFDVLVEDDSFPAWETGQVVARRFALGCLRDMEWDPPVYFPNRGSLRQLRERKDLNN